MYKLIRVNEEEVIAMESRDHSKNGVSPKEPKGIYYYFLAYIKYDYFERKYLNITPNWEETLQTAIQTGLPTADITQLFEILQVEMPECLKV